MEWWSRRKLVGMHVKDLPMTHSCVEEMSETAVSDPTALREKGFPNVEALSQCTLYICKQFLDAGNGKTLMFFLLHG